MHLSHPCRAQRRIGCWTADQAEPASPSHALLGLGTPQRPPNGRPLQNRSSFSRSGAAQGTGALRTWRDCSERRCLLLRRCEKLCVARHRSYHLHQHGLSLVVAPTVRDALIICRSNSVVQSVRARRERIGRFYTPSRTRRRSSGAAAFSLAKSNLPCAPSVSCRSTICLPSLMAVRSSNWRDREQPRRQD